MNHDITGLELVMKSLRKLHGTRFKDFCSLADFISLSCVVATDYAAEKAEEEGGKHSKIAGLTRYATLPW